MRSRALASSGGKGQASFLQASPSEEQDPKHKRSQLVLVLVILCGIAVLLELYVLQRRAPDRLQQKQTPHTDDVLSQVVVPALRAGAVDPWKAPSPSSYTCGPWVLKKGFLSVHIGCRNQDGRGPGPALQHLEWSSPDSGRIAPLDTSVAFQNADLFTLELQDKTRVSSSLCTVEGHGPALPEDFKGNMAVEAESPDANSSLALSLSCPASGGHLALLRWSIQIFPGTDNTVLRWRLQTTSPDLVVEAVSASMHLFGARTLGTVDGSPVVASATSLPQWGRMTDETEPLIDTIVTASASGSEGERHVQRVLDQDTESEWFAPKGVATAWIELDLSVAHDMKKLVITWWANPGEEVSVLAAADDRKFWTVWSRGRSGAPGQLNAVEVVTGNWKQPCRFLQMRITGKQQDVFGLGVYIGIRELELFGRPHVAGPGYRAGLWANVAEAPALWFAFEEPRAACSVKSPPSSSFAAANAPSETSCYLSWPAGLPLEVSGSIGFCKDGRDSSDRNGAMGLLRRSFLEYLQRARGAPLGQSLHYNSWFDLRSFEGGAWEDIRYKQPVHEMTDTACTARIAAINGNLSGRGAGTLDAFLLDDGWDNHNSIWETAMERFPQGFGPLIEEADKWNTGLAVWMSPIGGYAGRLERLRAGKSEHLEIRNNRFQLSGERYFKRFQGVAMQRIKEGFTMFKFDGIGGGLGQSGAGQYVADFEAMLRLVASLRVTEQEVQSSSSRGARSRGRRKLWINLTIGSWPSPFWLLWVDSIWKDGPDVGLMGPGGAHERWLTYRDQSALSALRRAPLYPLPSLMQHGVIWSRIEMAADAWGPDNSVELFRKEVLTFFLSGIGLQELYIQLELLGPAHWDILAEVVAFTRKRAAQLRDAHWIGGSPKNEEAYGVASYGLRPHDDVEAPPANAGLLYWRNPSARYTEVRFTVENVLELPAEQPLPQRIAARCWEVRDLALSLKAARSLVDAAPAAIPAPVAGGSAWSSGETIRFSLGPFAVRAFELLPRTCAVT